MAFSDIISIFQWWLLLFVMGILFYPVSSRLFSVFSDKGYIFSKILSISVATYITFVLGTIGIIRFASIPTPLFALILLGTLIFLQAVFLKTFSLRAAWRKEPPSVLLLIVFEELLFGGALFLWSYIRSFQPDINGLEKLMDYGFINSILRSDAFPPKDMWFTPFSINYYYFGHLLTAVLTKLAAIPSEITYNLMIASLFALTMCSSFSIGYNLFANVLKKATRRACCRVLKIVSRRMFRFGISSFPRLHFPTHTGTQTRRVLFITRFMNSPCTRLLFRICMDTS